jgi:hypothetical protein
MPPKPRSGPSRKPTTAGRDRTQLLWVAGAAGLVVVAVVVWLVVGNSGSSEPPAEGAIERVAASMEEADCTLTSVAALPQADHSLTEQGDTSDRWNTNPPTSGPHNSLTAVYGRYRDPLDQAQVVHNLEHGAVFIQYGPGVPEATVTELESFYDGRQNGTLLAPHPGLGDTIALGVWTVDKTKGEDGTAHLAECTGFDEDAFAAFFDEFQFHGPESAGFPPESMLPGRQ